MTSPKLGVYQLRLDDRLAHETGNLNLWRLLTDEYDIGDQPCNNLVFDGGKLAVTLGLGVADIVILRAADSLHDIAKYLAHLRAIEVVSGTEAGPGTKPFPLVVESLTTYCVKSFDGLAEEEPDQANLEVQIRLQTRNTPARIATLARKIQEEIGKDQQNTKVAMRMTAGLFDYTLQVPLSNLSVAFDNIASGLGENGTSRNWSSTALFWPVERVEPTNGSLRLDIAGSQPPMIAPLNLTPPENDKARFLKLHGPLVQEIEALLNTFTYFHERSLLPSSRPIRYSTREVVLFLNEALESFNDYYENDEAGRPQWLFEQPDLLSFVSLLRRELEKRVASALQLNFAYETSGHHNAPIKLLGVIEAASRMYASTIQCFACTEGFKYCNVLVLDSGAGAIDFTIEFDYQRYTFSQTRINPRTIWNVGTTLGLVLHEYNQCVILDLHKRNSLTSGVFNQALIELNAGALYESYIELLKDASSKSIEPYEFANFSSSFGEFRLRFEARVYDNLANGIGHELLQLSELTDSRITREIGKLVTNDSLSFDRAAFEKYALDVASGNCRIRFFNGPSIDAPDAISAAELWMRCFPHEVFLDRCEFDSLYFDILTEDALGVLDGSNPRVSPDEDQYAMLADRMNKWAKALAEDYRSEQSERFSDELRELASTGLLFIVFLSRSKSDEETNQAIERAQSVAAHLAVHYHLMAANREQPEEVRRNILRWLILIMGINRQQIGTFDDVGANGPIAALETQIRALANEAISLLQSVLVACDPDENGISDEASYSTHAYRLMRALVDTDEISSHSGNADERSLREELLNELMSVEAQTKMKFVAQILNVFLGSLAGIEEEKKNALMQEHKYLDEFLYDFFLRDSNNDGQLAFHKRLFDYWAMQYALESPYGDIRDVLDKRTYRRLVESGY